MIKETAFHFIVQLHFIVNLDKYTGNQCSRPLLMDYDLGCFGGRLAVSIEIGSGRFLYTHKHMQPLNSHVGGRGQDYTLSVGRTSEKSVCPSSETQTVPR